MNNCDELRASIIEKQLCCICGTCAGVCPTNAVLISDSGHSINSSLCINCGNCIETCPGGSFNFPFFTTDLFGAEEGEYDNLLGKYVCIEKAYAADPQIRNAASSGGALTAIALYMLRNGLVDGIVGIVPSESGAASWRPDVLRTEDEVKAAMQSKYTIVPTNTVLRDLMVLKGRYVYVGLPCQIQGLRKAQKRIPVLRERIAICFGIFCGLNMSYDATAFLLRKAGISRSQIESIEYRGKRGEETGFLVKASEKDFFISKHGYALLNAFFSPKRCWKCYDLTAEYADISFGDAWEMPGGGTRVIVRSKKGLEYFSKAKDAKELVSYQSTKEDICITQRKIVNYKKREISVRQLMMHNFPDYNTSMPDINGKERWEAIFNLLCFFFGHTGFARFLLRLIPIKMFEKLSRSLRKSPGENAGEFIKYIFWGGITLCVSFFSYYGLILLGIDYKYANIISIIASKTTAYLSNKFFVFKRKRTKFKDTFMEIGKFILARGLSGIVEYAGTVFLVEVLGASFLFGKGLMLVIETILNYTLGKMVVFRDLTKRK